MQVQIFGVHGKTMEVHGALFSGSDFRVHGKTKEVGLHLGCVFRPMGKLRKYVGQCFQVQISGSVGNYGSTWHCIFRVFGKTKEVHGTVFSGLWENKGSTGGSVSRFSFQVLLENYGNAWSCFFRCRFWESVEEKNN